jgi:PEP-CTERM motif
MSSSVQPAARGLLIASATLCLSQAVLAVSVAPAPAQLAWGLSAENISTQTFNYKSSDFSQGALSSDGLQSINSDGVIASVNAWADPVAGVFKAVNSVQMTGTVPTSISESYARLDMGDTVRISGPGALATLTLTMDYDTTFSGLGLTPFERVGQISHFMQVDSSRYMSVSYTADNPFYDPNAQCEDFGSDGVFCPPEAQQKLTYTASADKSLFKEWALGGPNGVYSNGDVDNGRYTGQVSLTLQVPTGVDVDLSFTVYSGARCFHLANCALTTDASHSDYIGLRLDQGYSFASANGYRYLGTAAAVPEPSGFILAGLGLVVAGVSARRIRSA